MRATPTDAPPEGFTYLPEFLAPDEQAGLLRALTALDYHHDTFRGRPLNRGYAQFGHAYVSTGRRLELAPPIPDVLLALAGRVAAHCPLGTAFDQCIVTHYPVSAGIGWHPDAPCFGDCIAAVSLGQTARLQFRQSGATKSCYEVHAAPGSLYVMCGPARWEFQHQVMAVRAERYSVTFRRVARPS